MEALDRESFEFRAEFFGRTLEEELVGCLDGPRGGEARMQLETVAARRNRRIEEIIAEERQREREREPVLVRWRILGRNESARASNADFAESPPKEIFMENDCPICQEAEVDMGALRCGHVMCQECHACMRRHTRSDRMRCPCCRLECEKLFPVC